jgi:hypothetical protein
MLDAVMGVIIDLHDTGFWKTETWKDYGAPIVRRGADGQREGSGQLRHGVPRKRIPPDVRPFDTMRAPRPSASCARSLASGRSRNFAWFR